uniref:Ig-like domain-containing protein n=1 Tax=Strix occidentalis caurina TaxID=311401 RepID=A0A8D0F001_STROC
DMTKNNEIIPPAVATLVCLASDFHPDHLKLFWKVNGAKRTEGAQTDEFSTQNEITYSLTSQLRISAQEWFNPLNCFECVEIETKQRNPILFFSKLDSSHSTLKVVLIHIWAQIISPISFLLFFDCSIFKGELNH